MVSDVPRTTGRPSEDAGGETPLRELLRVNDELALDNLRLRERVSQLEAQLDELRGGTREKSSLAENAPDIIVRFDRECRHLYVNPAVAEATGRPPADFLGRTNEELGMPADLCQRWRRTLGSVFETGSPAEDEFGFDTPEGTRIYWLRAAPEVDERGAVASVLCVVRDITDLRRAQAELRHSQARLEAAVRRRTETIELMQTVATAANHAATVDEALSEIIPELARHMGAGCAQTWLRLEHEPGMLEACGSAFAGRGGRLEELLATTPRRRLIEDSPPLREVMTRGEPVWTDDLAAVLGSVRAVSARTAGLRLAAIVPITISDDVVGVVELMLITDSERRTHLPQLVTGVGAEIGRVVERITYQKRLAEVAAEEQRKLGRELHDGVAQEIAALRMLAEVLQRDLEQGAAGPGSAALVVESARKAQEHVRSLARGLVPATIASGGLRSALGGLAQRFESEHGVPCLVEIPDGLVVDNSVIATSLYYIAQEATLNAVRHGGARQVTISLAEYNGVMTMRVVDDGSGFEPSRSHGHFGSGLRIMVFRARQLGGQVSLASAPGQGTTVTCTVPLRGASEA